MGNVNPKSSSLPKVGVKYVNKGEEESLKSVTADLKYVANQLARKVLFIRAFDHICLYNNPSYSRILIGSCL